MPSPTARATSAKFVVSPAGPLCSFVSRACIKGCSLQIQCLPTSILVVLLIRSPQVLKTAEEGEGDMEVLDAQFEMAKMWAKIGDKVSVL